MKSYLCSALVLLAMVSCDSKKEAVKPSYKTPDMKLASDVMTPEVLWSFGRIGSVSVSPDQKTLVYDVTYFNKEEDRSYLRDEPSRWKIKTTDRHGLQGIRRDVDFRR